MDHLSTLEPRQSASEAEARIACAALYRLVEHYGWGEGIFNHIALRLPDDPDSFLIKPNALAYDEVTASSLIRVRLDEPADERIGVNGVGYRTHAPILQARPDVACSIHLHTFPIMAIAALPGGLKMLNVQSVLFHDNIGYLDFESGEAEETAIPKALGDKRVLIMRNHGAVITGSSPENTLAMTMRFIVACELQLRVDSCGVGAIEMSPEFCRKTLAEFRKHDTGRGGDSWPAWLRKLDRLDRSYRD